MVETENARICFDVQVADGRLTYALIPATHEGRWVWGKKAGSQTFEFPGGHIQMGESPLDAAQRELMEESGATQFDIWPVCAYAVSLRLPDGSLGQPVYGHLFYADIQRFGDLEHEIASIALFEQCPDCLSYPDIQPHIMDYVKEWLAQRDLSK